MVLPLYLAMTAGETADAPSLPPHFGWMACHFSPDGTGLCALPEVLPPGAMLILNDRFPCRGHDPGRIAAAVERLDCGSLLLDFEGQPESDSIMVANALFQALTCPVAAPPGFVEDSDCAVFLPPCPLHIPLTEYLHPWHDREVWLDTALQRQIITVTRGGTVYGPAVPADRLEGGVFDEILHCQYLTEISADAVRFTLFDTPDTLKSKMAHAASLGVSRAVGLYQELNEKL